MIKFRYIDSNGKGFTKELPAEEFQPIGQGGIYMYYVMEDKNDVIISSTDQVAHNKSVGMKVVGVRKTLKGADRLANKHCDTFAERTLNRTLK